MSWNPDFFHVILAAVNEKYKNLMSLQKNVGLKNNVFCVSININWFFILLGAVENPI
jgi:hypothetical protein